MDDRSVSPQSLLMYIGVVLLLTGSIAAKGSDMMVVLLGGVAILLLEVVELTSLSHERMVLTKLVLGSTLLLLTIIKAVESIGRQFTTHHLYLMIMLIGLILILIEDLRRYTSVTPPAQHTAR